MSWLTGVNESLRPPPPLTGSQWADTHYRLTKETAAMPGRWRTRPYQREVLDAMTDVKTERVTWMKSARIGATLTLGAASGYFAEHDPSPQFFVLPTVALAEKYSVGYYAPMIAACDALHAVFGDPTVKKSGQTILVRNYPGGPVRFVGSNSAAGFRMVQARIICMDEVSAFAPSAGDSGDPVSLAEKRGLDFWNRKVIAISTPKNEGTCRVTALFLEGDQRRFHVPCPHCGHTDYMVFTRRAEGEQHYMRWPEGEPEKAYYVCGKKGCIIEEQHKERMVAAGRFVPAKKFEGHASFHVWAAYATSPQATWGLIAKEFEEKKKNPEELRVFVNETLGEVWEEPGDAPDWEHLYARREQYPIGTVPRGVAVLTCGVDVQHDRFVYEVVGWALNKESWSIEAGELYGDTANAATYAKLNALLDRQFPSVAGDMTIRKLAIDSSDRTQDVYNWARRHPRDRVMTCKGSRYPVVLVGLPKKVDVKTSGKVLKNGHINYSTGVNIGKGELYGWLNLRYPEDGQFPDGWCHFPENPPEYFKQLTGEQLVTVRKKSGVTVREWRPIPGRENHFLDCRILARIAASVVGLDRYRGPRPSAPEPARAETEEPRAEQEPRRRTSQKRPGWMRKGRRKGGWVTGR